MELILNKYINIPIVKISVKISKNIEIIPNFIPKLVLFGAHYQWRISCEEEYRCPMEYLTRMQFVTYFLHTTIISSVDWL